MKFKVYTADGSSSSEKEFAQFPVFEGEKGRPALRQVLIAYQANQRQGNASTKVRNEVSGTGKKFLKQKGSGGSRHKDRRAPTFVKGGIVFGPRPRDYSQKINAKVRSLALGRALFERAQKGEIELIEGWEVNQPKTKILASVIQKIAPTVNSVLIIDDVFSDNVKLSVRNLPTVIMNEASDLNALDVVSYSKIIMSEKSLNTLLARISGE